MTKKHATLYTPNTDARFHANDESLNEYPWLAKVWEHREIKAYGIQDGYVWAETESGNIIVASHFIIKEHD